MFRQTRTSVFIFLAAVAVYSGQLTLASGGNGATPGDLSPATEVKMLAEPAGAVATTAPATNPAPQGQDARPPEVNVNDDGTVEMHVNDASLVQVLRMLSLQSQKNIIASKDVHGSVTANLYDVTVREALDAILHANGYAYREQGSFIYVYTAKELAEIEKAERHKDTDVFRLFYTPAANAANMIKPVLSSDAQVSFTTAAEAGLDTGTTSLGGNSHATQDMLVVSDYAENLERVRQVLKELDRRPQQILIEATILQATLNDANQLGVDFNVAGGVNFAQAVSSAGQLTSAELGTGNPKNGLSSVGSGNNFSQGINGYRVGIVTNNVSVFLAALEQVTNTVILANPKILALNKQKGEVIVGREDGYLTTTVTQSASVQTVDFLDTGTRLIFRPYIGDDGYIRMEIHPEDSSGGLTSANLPYKVTTECTSNVMVKDGNTVVIGGLFREDSSSSRSQVPFLGSLPLAGYLFRNQLDQTTRQEVIILLTPHIVKDDTAYSHASEQELQDAEKLRVGTRQGMMPFGRECLADTCYQKAVQEMDKPQPDRKKALWYLDCAINLNPTFIEAIDLRQQVTGREVTAADNSTIRGFVRRQILSERAKATTAPVSDKLPVVRIAATHPASAAPKNAGPQRVPGARTLTPATQPLNAAAPTTRPVSAVAGR